MHLNGKKWKLSYNEEKNLLGMDKFIFMLCAHAPGLYTRTCMKMFQV